MAVGDSELIIKYLEATYKETLPFPRPTDAQSKAIITSVRRICEEHLFFSLGYYRFICEEVCRGQFSSLLCLTLHFFPPYGDVLSTAQGSLTVADSIRPS